MTVKVRYGACRSSFQCSKSVTEPIVSISLRFLVRCFLSVLVVVRYCFYWCSRVSSSQLRLSRFSLVLLLFWVMVQFIFQVIIITIVCYIVGY